MTGSPVLARAEVAATAAWIAARQRPDGVIGWTREGPADPWNHVEAAMALDVAGRHDDARRAYRALLDRQRPDGLIAADLCTGGGHVDTNGVAYLAAGAWLHVRATGDPAAGRLLLPAVAAAVEAVLDRRLPAGGVAWSVDPAGAAAEVALVAGASSVVTSLRAAAALADWCGAPRPSWSAAAERLATDVAAGGPSFLDKSVFAMDWYYPVLGGAVTGDAARRRLIAGAATFGLGDGVRCRSDGRWVTAAESAEAAMAHLVAGLDIRAIALLGATRGLRCADGGYLTGVVLPERSHFPAGERTTYSAAAVVLAADLVAGGAATSSLFIPRRTSTRRLPVRISRSSANAPEAMASA